MKGFWIKFIAIVTAWSIIFSFSGCSKRQKSKSVGAAQTQLEKQKLEIKSFVKQYYESEVPKDEKYLKDFFINPNIADIQFMKNKLKIFNIEKIKFNGIYNIKSSGRLAAMTGSFNAYFKNIPSSRPDVEIVMLIKKNNKWYFLNDDSMLNETELMWENNQKQIQNKFIVNDKNMNKILETNKIFDEANKGYMDQCKEKFVSSQSGK
ncbi:hypothetical protein LQK79_06385 [Clostridium guangxiense]|nr:hypothetical protein [Clostridium guangxiense]